MYLYNILYNEQYNIPLVKLKMAVCPGNGKGWLVGVSSSLLSKSKNWYSTNIWATGGLMEDTPLASSRVKDKTVKKNCTCAKWI